jgi:hypothetical protein
MNLVPELGRHQKSGQLIKLTAGLLIAFLPTVCPHVWANKSISFNHVGPTIVDFPGIFSKICSAKRALFEFEPLQGHL